MLGKVIKVYHEKQLGVILGDDNKPYMFSFSAWCEEAVIKIGLRVEFDPVNEKQANNVFLTEQTLPEVIKTEKSLGKIVKLSQEKQLALVLADSGKQYVFRFQDWHEACIPTVNMRVRFEVMNDKQVHQVYLEDEFDSFESKESRFNQTKQNRFTEKSVQPEFNQQEQSKPSEPNILKDKKTGRPICRLVEPSMTDYIRKNFMKFEGGFEGRASVKEYWACILFNIAFIIVTGLLAMILVAISKRNEGLALLVFILPNLYAQIIMHMVVVRRLHDIDYSFWAFFGFSIGVSIIGMIPILNIIVAIIYIIAWIMLFVYDSIDVENKFGLSTAYTFADEES